AVLPVVIGREISSGPAQQRYVQLFRGVQHVAPVAVAIGKRRLLVEHASLDAAPKVFDEVTVDLRVDIVDHAFGIDLDARSQWSLLSAQYPRGCCQGPRKGASRECRFLHFPRPCADYLMTRDRRSERILQSQLQF